MVRSFKFANSECSIQCRAPFTRDERLHVDWGRPHERLCSREGDWERRLCDRLSRLASRYGIRARNQENVRGEQTRNDAPLSATRN